MLFFLLIDDIP